ncbi:cytochrome P450 [Dacryopinax primogenitus]|uniref:Cytochrome P450 n=1 Tax=Dacryopinax primogenitus (strain DJM 731) TaxID=1858805 RepID=M5FZM5_DACPD|nr:cytochrome P450 [Dacryopinax primogenitus]EJT99016.1 cytochrome P450 [Dacryopinax primogenitus]
MHKELGGAFLTVSPVGVTLVLADPEAISQVCASRERFPKPPNTGAIINLFGPNVISTDHATWRLHRKVTGPVFSEKIHASVWSEGRRQAQFMLDSWLPPSYSGSRSTAPARGESVVVQTLFDDTLKLGLHVITGSAYACPLSWSGACSNPPTTSKQPQSYSQSVEQLNNYLMPLFLTPRWLLRAARGGEWGRAWSAYLALGGYLEGMLKREKDRRQWGDDPTPASPSPQQEQEQDDEGPKENLLSVLLDSEEGGDEKERRMTHDEVLGNAFIFMFAGHETTANTTHYALLLLALHQAVQSRLHSELDALLSLASSQNRDLDYTLDFPHATYTLAVMQETLRLYTPTSIINKSAQGDQRLAFEGKEYVVPGGTRVAVNITGVHSSPKVWGEDVGEFRPERWLVPVPASASASASASKEPSRANTPAPPGTPLHSQQPEPELKKHTLLKPARGSYLPFSEGTRQCSGRKFASVEFVSVLYTLLSNYRVEILGEREGWGEQRVRRVLGGRRAGALTLQVPERVPVRFVRRK